MNNIEDYLNKTESATKKLIEGIVSYTDVLKEAKMPVFISDSYEDYESWEIEHIEQSDIYLEAQKNFLDESFAMSTLCGALLQIASMGIQKYSSCEEVLPNFRDVIRTGTKPVKFCIGRHIKDIPIGLIIYAGRNQYNHFDDGRGIREPSFSIFEKLCILEVEGVKYREPAFDLQNDLLLSYASNITAILEWISYENYLSDMKDMLL